MASVPPVQGSFDRFMQTHAPRLLYGDSAKRASTINIGIGVGLIVLALSLGTIGLASSDPDILIGGLIGPLSGGIVNLIVGATTRRRAGQFGVGRVELDAQTRGFLSDVMRRAYGIRFPLMRRKRQHLAMMRGVAIGEAPPERESREYFHPELAALLERATHQYNRLYGMLDGAGAGPTGALTRMRATLYQAADEAIVEVLRTAASFDKYPESSASLTSPMESKIAQLKEAADRVEALTRQSELATQVAPSGPMDRVLEELRLEQIAHEELARATETEEPRNELRNG